MLMSRLETRRQTGAMITSGGGFSDRWPRPAYQQGAVSAYLQRAAHARGAGKHRRTTMAEGLPPAALFNASGRGYPDVAAVSQNVPVYFNGSLQMVGGTSSAAPIVGGIFALLNGERARLGLPPLGLVLC